MATDSSSSNLTFTLPPPAGRFSPADICAILDQCSRSGVQRLRFESLDVEFFHEEHKDAPTESRESQEATGATPPENLFEANELRVKRDKLEMLRLTDPEAYEEAVLEGDLVPEQEDEDAGEIA